MTTDARPRLLVTGAASGLGEAIARVASGRGWTVGCLDVDADRLAEVEASDEHLVALPASTTEEAAVEAALDRFGVPDALVNNAGIVRFGPLLELAADDWRAAVDVNLTGTFLVARAVARRWHAEGRPGAIVNVTSMNGVMPGPNAGAYGATKAGVALLTSQMALEWAPNVRVNAVAPGLIDAGMSAPIYADAHFRERREAAVPLGRLGTPSDVADVVLWLLSHEARYVTGENLLVDGGVTRSMIATLPRPAAVDTVGDIDPA